MRNSVITRVQTPADLLKDGISFVIPSYQRPYVWPNEDVLKLLDDIDVARKANEPHYYIGTVLTGDLSNSHVGDNPVFELIDGQQRATTLILIALVLDALKIDSPLVGLATMEGKPRLTFAIRDQVQGLLGAWAGLDGYRHPGDEAVQRDPYLTRLHGALHVLHQKLDKMEVNELESLAEYIHGNVQWVNNVMPQGMDLNRMFATMNTSGVQLEQSDLLKARLLKQISRDKAIYEAVWQACEQMDNYFERNVRQVFSGSNWNAIKPEQLSEFDRNLFVLPNKGSHPRKHGSQKLTITELAAAASRHSEEDGKQTSKPIVPDQDEDDELVYCRSIIGFPLLLMHAYRIYREDKSDIDVRLHSDRLIESFGDLKKAPEKEVKAFIKCLWEVRYQFDRWVVKWQRSDDSGEAQLGLTNVSRSKSRGRCYLRRTLQEQSSQVLLQSVRYFTGERSAQYWLTPFIGWLMTGEYNKESEVLYLLEYIDNQLSLAGGTQKEASFELLKDDLKGLVPFKDIENYLSESKGTHFEHYWFQKLEYLLWKIGDKREPKFKRYRIVSRNSVEHVHPQNEERGRSLNTKYLDAFGNLVLLNPGQNSSYGPKAVKRKKTDFESKPAYDALKLKHIFELMGDGEWTKEKIAKHQFEMLELLAEHYGDY